MDQSAPLEAQPPAAVPVLYIRNLHEKVRLETLIKSLRLIFSPYGAIKDIICKRHIRLRGQAYIVFEKQESADKAFREINGFPLFSKPMDVHYAREKSFCGISDEGELEALKAKRKERQLHPVQVKRVKAGSAAKGSRIPDAFQPPNKILFIQNLGPDMQSGLEAQFSQYSGYAEVRMVAGKDDIAFVEFENEGQAGVARDHLNNWTLDGKRILVSFAKK